MLKLTGGPDVSPPAAAAPEVPVGEDEPDVVAWVLRAGADASLRGDARRTVDDVVERCGDGLCEPAVDFGVGGGATTTCTGATRGGGLVVAVLSLENDQPSKPPGITLWFVAPRLLYFHVPPFDAYQYPQ